MKISINESRKKRNLMTIPFEEIKAEWLADPEVQREYDALAPEFEALAKSLAAEAGPGYQIAQITPHPPD